MNKKGFTLIELLAVMVVLGVLMTMTIPNIIGITTANKTQAYAEDAKKMVSMVEYMLRGNDAMEKPKNEGECVIVSLEYIGMGEFQTAPYGGEYDPYESYVVMRTEKDTEDVDGGLLYNYYVQLYEQLPDGGWRGFRLLDASGLDGDGYIDKIDESEEAPYLRARKAYTSLAKERYLMNSFGRTLNEVKAGDTGSKLSSLTESEHKKRIAARIWADENTGDTSKGLCGKRNTDTKITKYYFDRTS